MNHFIINDTAGRGCGGSRSDRFHIFLGQVWIHKNPESFRSESGCWFLLSFFTIEIEIDKKIEKSKTKNVFCLVINIWLDTIG